MPITHGQAQRVTRSRDARGRFVPADPWRQISRGERIRLQVISASVMALTISVLVLALVLLTPVTVH